MNLGKVLEDWRFMNKLGQKAAADVIGVPVSVLQQLEQGKDVKGSNLATVLSWLTSEPQEAAPVQLRLEDRRAG